MASQTDSEVADLISTYQEKCVALYPAQLWSFDFRDIFSMVQAYVGLAGAGMSKS